MVCWPVALAVLAITCCSLSVGHHYCLALGSDATNRPSACPMRPCQLCCSCCCPSALPTGGVQVMLQSLSTWTT